MKSGINSLNKFVPFSLIFDQSAAEWNQKRVGVSLYIYIVLISTYTYIFIFILSHLHVKLCAV